MIQAKNIIFDLGGVILDIDYNLTVSAFRELGIARFDEHFTQAVQSSFFENFEKGLMTEEDFYPFIQTLSGKQLNREEIDMAWNKMLVSIPLRRLQVLQQLQLYYNTFLLSNTNAVHEKSFNKLLKEVCGFETLAVFFDKVYFSHRVGMRKPDKEIFRLLIDECGLRPEETLFIDDSIQHIRTADELGIQTIHLSNGMTIEKDVFRSRQ